MTLTVCWYLGRIHFCIYYPDLGIEARLEIWRMFFRRVLGEEGMKVISTEDFNKLSALEMNGRQVCITVNLL